MSDFNALATQLQAATPTGVNADKYTPINTAKRACPTVDSNWRVAAKGLPPTPNSDYCSCMASTFSCQAKATLTDKEIQAQFDWICGPDGYYSCTGFSPDTGKGDYPPRMMCNGIDKLSWAFDTYYQHFNSKPEVCNFNGNATLVTPSKSAAACASLLNVAVPTGTSTGGTTGPTGHGSTTTSGTGSTKTSTGSTTSGTNKSSAGHVGVTTPFSFIGPGLGIFVLGLVVIGGGAFVV
jgi:1,3-beta-glucanosyltransferase GAS1